MSKSTGNFMTLDSVSKEFSSEALAFRYLCFLTHYRKSINFKGEALIQASAALTNLRRAVSALGETSSQINEDYKNQFSAAINDDLNMPQAIAVLQSLLKSDLLAEMKLATIKDFDRVLGLDLVSEKLPQEIVELISARDGARAMKDFDTSDQIRKEIEEKAYIVEAGPEGRTKVVKK